MAQARNDLRDLLEKIKGDAQRALAVLPSEAELRSLGWKMRCLRTREAFSRGRSALLSWSAVRNAKASPFGRSSTLRCPLHTEEVWLFGEQVSSLRSCYGPQRPGQGRTAIFAAPIL
jgi:hypothetical protein